MSGITDVLFNSKANPDGTVTTEPMVAIAYELDPSLESAEFTLREDIQFHNGVGEMTAQDVVFSFNDANSVTNPESIHGQAGDFAPLILSMEAIDPYKVKLNYRNYDSRGILHRFSMFWQTAGIVSKAEFDRYGVEGLQDVLTGIGPFVAEEWNQNEHILLHANTDYYRRGEGTAGPWVERVRWLEVPEAQNRRAMLETGEAQISQVVLKDIPDLKLNGFQEQRKAQYNVMDNIGFTGNWWETESPLTGAPFVRERDISKPWVGDPFQNGPTYDENTPSMQSSRLVRNALAWSIDRQALLDSLLSGLGFINHQPYLTSQNPNYSEDWSWGTDYEMGRQLLQESGHGDGFDLDMWVGTDGTVIEIGESVAAAWSSNLNVNANLIKTAYQTYRPGLVARNTTTPFIGCGDENKSNFPYDWAHGFVMSGFSAGGYGVGMEVPFATDAYSTMAGEPDPATREDLSATFYESNRHWALCVGVFERPLWPAFDPSALEGGDWDMRPMANGNLGAINGIESIRLTN
jgi:peptide/nickel transport system substrate-binding protein